MRRMFSIVAVAALALVCVGCNSGLPSVSYIQAHRKTHNQWKHVVDVFNADHPDEGGAAQDLWQSEEILISNAEKGVYPSVVQPVPAPAPVQARPRTRTSSVTPRAPDPQPRPATRPADNSSVYARRSG